MIDGGLAPNGLRREVVLHDIVVPVCQLLRSNRLPFENWWDPILLWVTLESWYWRWRVEEIGPPRSLKEMESLWGHTMPNVREALLQEATAPTDAALDFFVRSPDDEAHARLQQMAAEARVARAIDQALVNHSSVLNQRSDLLTIARFSYTIQVVQALLSQLQSVGVHDARLSEAREQFSAAIAPLSAYEVSLTQPIGRDEALVRRGLNLRRRTVFMDRMGVNALPDMVDGEVHIPGWVHDYVFVMGGRSYQGSAGPLVHWLAVMEADELAQELKVYLDETSSQVKIVEFADNGLLSVGLVATYADGTQMAIPFTYSPELVDHWLNLALLIETERLRFDLLHIDEHGRLQWLHTRSLTIPSTLRHTVSDRLLPLLTGLFTEGDEAAFASWNGEKIGAKYPVTTIGFLASDQAKSEELLLALNPLARPSNASADRDDIDGFRRARGALLDARIAISSGRGATKEQRQQLLDAERAYVHARHRLSSYSGGTALPRLMERVESLTQGLVSRDRAFLHLTISDNGYLDAFWVDRSEGHLHVGYLDLSSIPLTPLYDALVIHPKPDEEGLDAVLDATGFELGARLADTLRERNIRHLTISPIWFLHSFPLHALAVEPGLAPQRLLDVFDSISYAPSAGVLQEVRRNQPRKGGPVVAFAYGDDIPLTEAETRIIAKLVPNSEEVAGPGVTPTRVLDAMRKARRLHIACHGYWSERDYWQSGLQLSGGEGDNGLLTVAEIHRRAELRGIELVVLSTCHSGRSDMTLRTVDRYAGIDGAFLVAGARAAISTLWEAHDTAALLFTTAFYLAMQNGHPVAESYRRGIDLLRSGAYLAIHPGDEIGSLLSHAGVNWEEELEALNDSEANLRHPFYWAVFKMSGLIADNDHA